MTIQALQVAHYENDNGRIVCRNHAGVYLTEALEIVPDMEIVFTPVDTWYLMHPSEVEDFNNNCGVPCEECRLGI